MDLFQRTTKNRNNHSLSMGLKSPLETRRSEEQAGRGFAKGARHEPIPPAADSIVRSAGAFVFRGVAFFGFVSWR
ncbi:MAG: hypothetical protein K2Q15_11840, partial [Burkholderiales bacterium]|nr:hypothetical protein [Burkholderiales bacterium]